MKCWKIYFNKKVVSIGRTLEEAYQLMPEELKSVTLDQLKNEKGFKITEPKLDEAINLRMLRMKAGWTREFLAKKSGVSVDTIENYEQGFNDINGIGLKSVIALAQALNCKISDIIEDEEMLKRYKRVR